MDSTGPPEPATEIPRQSLPTAFPPAHMASGLRLRLLGPPRIALAGSPLAFTRRKTTALLIYLAVTGHSHTRDHLATLLWGDLPGHSAAANLRKVLTELRGQVRDHLLSDRDMVGLDSGRGIWLDIAAFEAGWRPAPPRPTRLPCGPRSPSSRTTSSPASPSPTLPTSTSGVCSSANTCATGCSRPCKR